MNLLYYLAMNMKSEHLEKVNHETAARPFSIHHTFVGPENTNALYLHCHPEAEFFCLAEGQLSFYVEDRIYELHGGDAIFIPPNLTHNAFKAPGESCDYDALVFSLEWLSGYLGGEGNLYVNTIQKNRMDSVIVYRGTRKEDGEALRRLSHYKEYAALPIHRYEMRLLGEIMISLQEIYDAVSEHLSYNEKTDASKEGVRRGIDYLMLHYDENISLSELVDSSGYSESHFCHRFKAITGFAPFAYLNRIRVIKAAERLIISDDKITKIAADCGFDNISYFNRVFRKQMEVSPGEYRQAGRLGREHKTQTEGEGF
ncbi:MAG: helix-turn-helix transcriptional regulator [Lachnospiraceae bacterium]|nr:helix-turn-helix transcriptional regulator [Lachnospiraceae bacterium]